MEAYLAEKMNLKVVQAPHDANTVVAGNRVPMIRADRISFLVNLGASTGATLTANLLQHNAASAGTSKALSIQNSYFVKKTTDSVFTRVEPGAASDVVDLSSIADDPALVVIEVLGEDLDRANNFDYVSLDLADATVTKLVSVTAIVDSDDKPAYADSI